MKKTILVLVLLLISITLLTVIADAFSRLSDSIAQYALFVGGVAIIVTSVYLLIKIKKQ